MKKHACKLRKFKHIKDEKVLTGMILGGKMLKGKLFPPMAMKLKLGFWIVEE